MDGTSVEGEDILNHFKSATSLHHDLEKLQQSHDELLHQVEAEKTANAKLKSELEESRLAQSKLEEQLAAKANELLESKKSIETLTNKLSDFQESTDRTEKLRKLAVKLKKDIAHAKDELEISRSTENQAKEQLKALQKEHEKVTSSYQQAIRNFQTLQVEYDKLQDEYDQCKAGAKTINTDLSNSVNELGKVKEELAEKMLEADNLTAKVNNLMEVISEFEGKCKELESTVIVLRSELIMERKKVVAGIGLEKSLEEYKNQLDIQTNTILNLEEIIEKFKAKESEYDSLRPNYESLCDEKRKLVEDVNRMNETISSMDAIIEMLNSSLEEEKIKSSELFSEKKNLEIKLKSVEEDNLVRVKNLLEEVSSLKESLSLLEEELKRKDDEFEAYKARVTKVLNQNKQTSNESDEVKMLKEKVENMEQLRREDQAKCKKLFEEKSRLENELRQANKEKEVLMKDLKRSDQLTEDNQKLKNLARDLQGRLVMERENHESEMKKMESDNNLMVQALRQEISDLKTKISYLEDELSGSLQQEKKDSTIDNSSLCQSCKSLASLTLQESSPIPSTCDYNSHYLDHHDSCHPSSSSGQVNDLSRDSIETNSPTNLERHTRLSSCSSSIQSHVNPLLEILNSKDDSDSPQSSNHFENNHLDSLDIGNFKKQLNDLSQLLKESESNNALLVEQNRVLKEEIRRIQRSIERADIVQNMEYLKNILVKFVSYDSGRSQLIPVLKTILKLSKSEEELFTSFAQNSNPHSTKLAIENQGLNHSNQQLQHQNQNQQSGNWSSFLWQTFS